MDILTTLKKSLLGFLTFAVGYLAANPDTIIQLIPSNLINLTIGGLVSALVVGITNWLKNRTK